MASDSKAPETRPVQLVVEYKDNTRRFFDVNPGWKVDNISRCIIIGQAIPRIHIPLDNVVNFHIEYVKILNAGSAGLPPGWNEQDLIDTQDRINKLKTVDSASYDNYERFVRPGTSMKTVVTEALTSQNRELTAQVTRAAKDVEDLKGHNKYLSSMLADTNSKLRTVTKESVELRKEAEAQTAKREEALRQLHVAQESLDESERRRRALVKERYKADHRATNLAQSLEAAYAANERLRAQVNELQAMVREAGA